MTLDTVHDAVVLTGRGAAMLFVAALVGRGFGWQAARLWSVSLAAQTVHFVTVMWFARANGGASLFPGGRGLQQVGGWPTLFGIFAFYYLLASLPLVTRDRVGRGWQRADAAAITLIGLFYVATYVPLAVRAPAFIFPIGIILSALAFVHIRESRSKARWS